MSIAAPETVRRIVFMGTPALAVPSLLALADAGYEIPLVVSRADARRGRGKDLQPSPVKAAALDLGLQVTDNLADVDPSEADLGVVVAYGRLIPTDLLDRLAIVNTHFSLLPRWRGAAPVERAILAGDHETGVCLMDLAEKLDTGDVYRRTSMPIGSDETLSELRGRLVEIGVTQLLDAIENGLGEPVPQQGEPHYAAKITKAERQIDWTQSAVQIHRRVRVGDAFTTARGKRIKIHRTAVADTGAALSGIAVETGDGTLDVLEVQPEGRGRLDARAWSNGARWTNDDRFGA